jgi:hypothetical protein
VRVEPGGKGAGEWAGRSQLRGADIRRPTTEVLEPGRVRPWRNPGGRPQPLRRPTGTRHLHRQRRHVRRSAEAHRHTPDHRPGARAPLPVAAVGVRRSAASAGDRLGKRRWGRGEARAPSHPPKNLHSTTIPLGMARPVELCMKSMRNTTGLGSGAGVCRVVQVSRDRDTPGTKSPVWAPGADQITGLRRTASSDPHPATRIQPHPPPSLPPFTEPPASHGPRV